MGKKETETRKNSQIGRIIKGVVQTLDAALRELFNYASDTVTEDQSKSIELQNWFSKLHNGAFLELDCFADKLIEECI